MKPDFETFMLQLAETNQSLDFFSDFKKIEKNVIDVKISLCTLNSLIGASNLRGTVEEIWKRDKKAFEVMDILIAVRKEGRKKVLNSLGKCVPLNSLFKSVAGVMEFLEGTGLAELFLQQKITNLVDYVFGVETGLDSNARKNRSGHAMESMVEEILKKNKLNYRREVYSREWPGISKVLGDDEKRFDFVIIKPQKKYLMEVNFYSGGGSKLNEVARAYSELSPKINGVSGFEFVWVTDGKGWNTARNKLQEAYKVIPRLYNLTTLKSFIEEIK